MYYSRYDDRLGNNYRKDIYKSNGQLYYIAWSATRCNTYLHSIDLLFQ
jgi:hypothetical protein